MCCVGLLRQHSCVTLSVIRQQSVNSSLPNSSKSTDSFLQQAQTQSREPAPTSRFLCWRGLACETSSDCLSSTSVLLRYEHQPLKCVLKYLFKSVTLQSMCAPIRVNSKPNKWLGLLGHIGVPGQARSESTRQSTPQLCKYRNT